MDEAFHKNTPKNTMLCLPVTVALNPALFTDALDLNFKVIVFALKYKELKILLYRNIYVSQPTFEVSLKSDGMLDPQR